MELWCRQMTYHSVPWNSMEHSMEFHGTLVPPNEVSLSSMELWDCHFMTCYPGLSRNIPRNSTEFWSRQIKSHKKTPSSMGFHGIRRAPLEMTQVFHGIPWNIPWNSMELWCRQMTNPLVPWNSMEYSLEFHETLVPPNEVSLSSMEFHGTFRLSFYDLDFQGIFHGILESPNKKSSKNHRDPWDSMELGGRHFKWHMFHVIPCYIPWKSGATKWNIT